MATMKNRVGTRGSFRNDDRKARTDGRVFVEKPDLMEEFDQQELTYTNKRIQAQLNRPARTIAAPSLTPSELLREQRLLQNQQTEALMRQNVQRSIEKRIEEQEREFPVLLSNVDKATDFLDSIDRDISLHDETQKNKTRRQFEEWNTNVHGKIQQRISKTVNDLDSKELNRRKHEDYEKFLSITNRKAAIFRDIIIESEYDPLEPNRNCIKAKTSKLKDPVKIDQQKAESEAAMLSGNTRNVKKPTLGKETLAVEQWASGKIEATPYGTFAKLMTDKKGGEAGKDSASQMRSATMQSKVVFDHFNYPKGKNAIEKEMPRGKRIHPTTLFSDPSRVFGTLPPKVEQEIAAIRPDENYAGITFS